MQVLQWAQDNGKHYEGGRLCVELIDTIRGHGGFDPNDADNYVGEDAISRTINAVKGTTHVMRSDGTIEVSMLESTMTNHEREELLSRYIRRAQLGYEDAAALVLGTGKDLLECVAKHICDVKHAPYGENQPFYQLLIAAWNALSMSIPDGKLDDGRTPYKAQIEHGLFDLGCGINKLRNAEGVGHGRPYPPNLTEDEAKHATEVNGADRALSSFPTVLATSLDCASAD